MSKDAWAGLHACLVLRFINTKRVTYFYDGMFPFMISIHIQETYTETEAI